MPEEGAAQRQTHLGSLFRAHRGRSKCSGTKRCARDRRVLRRPPACVRSGVRLGRVPCAGAGDHSSLCLTTHAAHAAHATHVAHTTHATARHRGPTRLRREGAVAWCRRRRRRRRRRRGARKAHGGAGGRGKPCGKNREGGGKPGGGSRKTARDGLHASSLRSLLVHPLMRGGTGGERGQTHPSCRGCDGGGGGGGRPISPVAGTIADHAAEGGGGERDPAGELGRVHGVARVCTKVRSECLAHELALQG